MPVHLGSHTKVHLVSANLRKTTTNEPSNKKAPAVTKHIENVEQTLQNGHILKENHISLGDDDTPLHLLGGEDYMPFMMVRAGEDLRQLSFLKTDKPLEDIRIDVLFNGQLTHSTMWPKRLFLEERKKHQLLNVFSGLRNHWMLERAWTIVPPGQDPNGSRRRPVANAETLEDRWNHIQEAVRREAAARGISKTGEKPVVARYLTEVSKLAMPPELKDWSEPRGQAFGVIDVVLTYGHGFKDSPCKVYISEPTRMRSSTFKDREDESISEGSSLSQKTNSDDDTGRYNLRRVTSDAGDDGRPNTSISRVPARRHGDKKSSQIAHDEEAHTPAGVSVEQEGKIVSTSERLPEYLSQAVIKAGYTLQQPESTIHSRLFSVKGPANFPSRISQQANSQPARGASYDPNNKRPAAPIVTQLQEIPEEEEDEPAFGLSNHLKSPMVARSGPLGFAGSSSSLNFGSSQDFDSSIPPTLTSSSSVLHLPGTGELLPPLEVVPGLRFRRIADPTESGSPRKKRRLSRSFPNPLDIKVPEGSIGITERGVFTKVGGPRDRSRFKSFTLSSHVDPQQVYVGRPPPISPITPDRNSFKNEDPLIKRLVFKAQGQVFHTFDVAIPIRLSELPVRTAHAHDNTQVQRAMDRRAANSNINGPPLPTAAPILPPIVFPSMPSTPVHQVSSSFLPPSIPHTPVAGRTRSESLDSTTSGLYHAAATGGIYHTPNPLPRHRAPQPATPAPPSATPAPPSATPAPPSGGQPTTGASTPASASSSTAPSSTAAAGRGRRFDDLHHPHAQMERLFRAWQTPALSRDCAVSYAAPPATGYAGQVAGGEWRAGMPRGFGGGVVRQVRSERTGEFEEEGVLVGVRFLVV
ncbi:hypothetical protein SLS56_011949 [Neofusicoccum ribis]|uniref:Uncharacterized protein n=1 Tax=Neofusicoccum ribis TaxID=45134 RepID=A0ABR3SA65_9PEZI